MKKRVSPISLPIMLGLVTSSATAVSVWEVVGSEGAFSVFGSTSLTSLKADIDCGSCGITTPGPEAATAPVSGASVALLEPSIPETFECPAGSRVLAASVDVVAVVVPAGALLDESQGSLSVFGSTSLTSEKAEIECGLAGTTTPGSPSVTC
ncbi:hypothetical protein OGATHE_001979 [Ogataea polymorpha]|uniref:Uncharacterized protein n=1 Tax=Ogataea polymorpha TaxID=460523 RepID=A0A9P8TCS8_9ASCO|nr:hypothetical protein OGATHE_001979 [Ogataea polymorpha]